jgi:formiminotetrahydrofolate cyclodeaminase
MSLKESENWSEARQKLFADSINEPMLAPFDLDLSQVLCLQYAIIKESHKIVISDIMFAAQDAFQGPTRNQGRYITHWSPGEAQ